MGPRKYFDSDWDYMSYVKAENQLIKDERQKVAKQADNPRFWINYIGFIAMLVLPQFIWYSWDFKGNPCKRADGSFIKR